MRRPDDRRPLFARTVSAAALLACVCGPALAQTPGDREGLEAFARAQVLTRSQQPNRLTVAQARHAIRDTQPRAPLRESIQRCGDQHAERAAARIDACTRVLEFRAVAGQTAGVTYALRGLAYLDRGDVPNAIADLDRAIALAPEFAPAYQNRGNAWYAKGNFGRAISDYDEAIRLDPDTAAAYVNRATAKRDLGMVDAALADYRKAIERDPQSVAAYRERGRIYLRMKDFERAIADFDRVVGHQRTAANHMLRAEALRGAGDLPRALADYTEAARLEPGAIAPWIAQGEIQRRQGDAGRALAFYHKAVAIAPNSAAAYRYLAEGYYAKGDRKRALREITRALKFSWTADYLGLRAQWRLADGDLAGAESDAVHIDKFEDDNPAALAVRGAIAARKNDAKRALALLDAALKKAPEIGFAYAERGTVHAGRGDNDRAMADLTRAIELGAGNAAVFAQRALLFKSGNDLARAIADLDRAIVFEPQSAALYYRRAGWHKASNDNERALADFSAAISRGTGEADAYFQRALLRLARDERAAAIADLDSAIARDSGKAEYFRRRGTTLLATKVYDKAATDFDNAIRLAPGTAGDHYQRGIAREQSSDLDKAAADFTLALSYERGNAGAQKALDRVRSEIKRRKSQIATREPDDARKKKTEPVKPGADQRAAKTAVPGYDGAVAVAPIERGVASRPAGAAIAIPLPVARPRIDAQSTRNRPASGRVTGPASEKSKVRNARENTARERQLHDRRRQRAIRQNVEPQGARRQPPPARFTEAFGERRR